MSLDELLPTVEQLTHSDKLRLIHWLSGQLAKEAGASLLSSDVQYPVWSPYEAHEAAATLAAFLEREKAARK